MVHGHKRASSSLRNARERAGLTSALVASGLKLHRTYAHACVYDACACVCVSGTRGVGWGEFVEKAVLSVLGGVDGVPYEVPHHPLPSPWSRFANVVPLGAPVEERGSRVANALDP